MRNRGKRGDIAFEVGYFVIRIILVAFILTPFIIMVKSFLFQDIKIDEIREDTVVRRAIYTSFAYRDDKTGRLYPGIVDKSKFSTESLSERFSSGNVSVAAKFVLKDLDSGEELVSYIDEERYLWWRPLAFSDRYSLLKRTQYVLIRDKDLVSRGIMTSDVVVSNE